MLAASLAMTLLSPAAPLERTIAEGMKLRYSVTLDTEGDGGEAHYEFEMRLTLKKEKKEDPEPKVKMLLTNLVAKFGEVTKRSGNFGAGTLEIGKKGLPKGMSILGPQGMYFMPLLAFYIPTEELKADSPVTASGVDLGEKLVAKVTCTKTAKPGAFDLDYRLGDDTAAATGKIKCSVVLNPKDSWPSTGEGSYSAQDGKMTFSLKRR